MSGWLFAFGVSGLSMLVALGIIVIVAQRGERPGWRSYQRSLQPRRFPLTGRGVAMGLGLLVALGALALLVLGCTSANATYEPQRPDLVASRDLERPTADLERAPSVDLAGPSSAPDLARSSQPDLDLAPRPDMGPARDLTPEADLVPVACTPIGGSCGTSSTCCADTLPMQVDGKSACTSSVCCAIAEIGSGCAGGHFKWCENCGSGWTCGACS